MTLPRLFVPALVVLAALLSACSGATSQLSPLTPGAIQPGQPMQPGVALGSAGGDTSAVGYVGYGSGDETPPDSADPAQGPFSEWDVTRMRSVELRRAVDDVRRLRILDDLREAEPGELIGIVGPGFGISSTGYNLGRLLRAYKSIIEWDPDAKLVLWQGNRKIGNFDDSGLTLLRPQ